MKALKIVSILITLMFSIEALGQNAVAQLHFESAEKAYNAGNYREVLSKLDEAEKLTGPMSKTLYLRIVAQDKLFAGGRNYATNDFELLSSLRSNTEAYLEVMAEQGLDDRYREVYRISESLSKFPATAEAWRKTREEEIQQKKEKEEQVIAQSKLREEQAKQAKKLKERDNFLNGKISIGQVLSNAVAKEVPNSTDAEDVATVCLIRPGRMTGSAGSFSFYINDYDAIKLRNKQHTIRRFSPGLLRIVQKALGVESNPILLDLESGKTYYIRLVAKVFETKLELIDEEEALKEMENTKLIER